MNVVTECQLEEFGSWDQMPELHRDDPIAYDPRWKAMRALIERPWFKRVWVVQEAGLSPGARILCGPVEIEWADLIRLETWLQSKAMFVWYVSRTRNLVSIHTKMVSFATLPDTLKPTRYI